MTKNGKVAALPPVAEMVTDPGLFVMLMFSPAVRVVSTGALPVDPIRICPFVGAAVETTLVGFEKYAIPSVVPAKLLASVTVPPKATVPPPDNPDPAATVIEGLVSMAFVTPAEGMLIVPLLVIGPPVKPAPVLMLVTVPLPLPPPPPKVCPGAKVIRPLLAMDRPVAVGVLPLDPKSKLSEPDGADVSFPVGSAIQRKSCVTADDVVLLNDEACRSSGFELKPWVAVAVPVSGNRAPASETVPVNVPVVAANPLVKAPVVPVSAPVSVPPASCR